MSSWTVGDHVVLVKAPTLYGRESDVIYNTEPDAYYTLFKTVFVVGAVSTDGVVKVCSVGSDLYQFVDPECFEPWVSMEDAEREWKGERAKLAIDEFARVMGAVGQNYSTAMMDMMTTMLGSREKALKTYAAAMEKIESARNGSDDDEPGDGAGSVCV